jgi:hypothetical protein
VILSAHKFTAGARMHAMTARCAPARVVFVAMERIASSVIAATAAAAFHPVHGPASVRRSAFSGQDDPDFVKIGSFFVIATPMPPALCGSWTVQSEAVAATLAGVSVVVLWSFWYAFPLRRRIKG